MRNSDILSSLALGGKHECQFPDERSIRPHGTLDPCQYQVSEVYRNVTVEVLTCPICGSVSISWRKQDDTEKIVVEDAK